MPFETVRALRAAGHDVFSASETAPGDSDVSHLERSIRDDRLIITFDRDFGELVTRGVRRPPAGIVLLRFVPKRATEVTDLLLAVLSRPDITWRNHLSVIDHLHIRQRPL